MMELIDKWKLYTDMLNSMCGTGFQSTALSVIDDQPAVSNKCAYPVSHNRSKTVVDYKVVDGMLVNGGPLYQKRIIVLENNPVEYCSDCGKRLCSRFRNYCPNCGAKIIVGGTDRAVE